MCCGVELRKRGEHFQDFPTSFEDCLKLRDKNSDWMYIFANTILPCACAGGKEVFKKDAVSKVLSSFVSPLDEAFCLLILSHVWDNWVEKNPDERGKANLTEEDVSNTSKSRYKHTPGKYTVNFNKNSKVADPHGIGGWDRKAGQVLQKLVHLVSKSRDSEGGKLWEQKYKEFRVERDNMRRNKKRSITDVEDAPFLFFDEDAFGMSNNDFSSLLATTNVNNLVSTNDLTNTQTSESLFQDLQGLITESVTGV